MTPSDLRALRGRARIPLYQLGAEIGLHPSRLGAMLNERVQMPPEVAARVQRVLEDDMAAQELRSQ